MPLFSWFTRIYDRCRLAAAILAGLLTIVLSESRANADVAPSCCEFDNDVTCAPASVGTSCPSGGTCMKVQCGAQMLSSPSGPFLYKCLQCPTVIADPNGQCASNSQIGQACGAGGTCSVIPTYCRSPLAYIACQAAPDSSAARPSGLTCSDDASAPDASLPNDAASPPDDVASLPDDAASIPDDAASLPDDAASVPDDATSLPDVAASIPDATAADGAPASDAAAPLRAASQPSGGCSCSATHEAGTLAGLLVACGLVALLVERRRSS